MKVGYILGTFPSVSETFILREILALRQRGIDVTVFSLRKHIGIVHAEAAPMVGNVLYRRSFFSPLMLLSQLIVFARMPLRYLGALRHYPLHRVAAGADFYRRAKAIGIDHTHAHFAYGTADVGSVMALFLDSDFSLSLHAKDIFTQPSSDLERRLAPAAFATVCTEYARSYLEESVPSMSAKIHLVRHGLFLDKFEPHPTTQPIIVGVGRLEEKKGFRYLIAACKIMAEEGAVFQCMIVGDGDQKTMLVQEAAQQGIGNRIQLTGELSQDDVVDLLRKASLFVLPCVVTPDGDRDGIPNAILEAMAMGLPVISSRTSAVPEAVVDGETGYLTNQGDHVALAKRIREVLGDEKLRVRMGAAARRRAEEMFDITSNIEPLIALFTKKGAETGT